MMRICSIAIALASLAVAQVPRVWDEKELSHLELPLAHPEYSAKHASSERYYKIPVAVVYKSQPVYSPGREPENYLAFLQSLTPELEWDPAKLPQTQAEWIRAGEALFEAPTRIGRIGIGEIDVNNPYVHTREWWEKVKPVVGGDGAVPGIRYVLRIRGKLEIGVNACSMCHSRVMDSGVTLDGIAGQFTYDAALAEDIRKSGRSPAMVEQNRQLLRRMYFTPWSPHGEIFDHLSGFDHQQMAILLDGHAGGVMSIDRAAPWAPVKVPDLIGIADRKYLGATGLVQQRSIDDLMRFIALHQSGDALTSFGDWTPPDSGDIGPRLSDEQIYALAQFLYSLKPPKNHEKANSFTKKGRAVFEREGCATCHSGPNFGGNKLMPAPGFHVPAAHLKLYDIIPQDIGTDPGLALDTRRGTGYYRVPPLAGLWYRTLFNHDGSVGDIGQWLGTDRLRKDFFTTGFGGLSGPQRAVKGHEYGLNLSTQDATALLAYLRTL
ncbi:MAG TPA: hypothetical protein VGL53_17785 [Bryobacteraceae bacterium]|jgi:hypothetical protein